MALYPALYKLAMIDPLAQTNSLLPKSKDLIGDVVSSSQKKPDYTKRINILGLRAILLTQLIWLPEGVVWTLGFDLDEGAGGVVDEAGDPTGKATLDVAVLQHLEVVTAFATAESQRGHLRKKWSSFYQTTPQNMIF